MKLAKAKAEMWDRLRVDDPRDRMKALETLDLIRAMRESNVIDPETIRVSLDQFMGVARQDGVDYAAEAISEARNEASRKIESWLSYHAGRGCDPRRGRIVARPDVQNGGSRREIRCECGAGAEVTEEVRRSPAGGLDVAVTLRELPRGPSVPRELELGPANIMLEDVVNYDKPSRKKAAAPAPPRERPTGRAPLALGEEV